MSTLVRLLAPIVCTVVALGACTAPPRAVAVRVSLGGFGISWPQDVQPLYSGLQRFADGLCDWASTAQAVQCARCRRELALRQAPLEGNAVQRVPGARGQSEAAMACGNQLRRFAPAT